VFLALLGLSYLFAWAPATVVAQHAQGATISREYTIKAGYLYNFGLYVRWPEEAFVSEDAPFVIGVLGVDPFGATLDQVAAVKRIGDRRIVVRRFDSLDQYRPCHILFVAKTTSVEEHFEAIRRLRATHVLLVGERPAFAHRGGTINFVLENNKIRFEVNQSAAQRGDLKISAKLLQLAQLVEQNNDIRLSGGTSSRTPKPGIPEAR